MIETNASIPEQLARHATYKAQGSWVPACGGTEQPFISRSGRRLLYCWQPSTGKHAYLDCRTDIILTQEEAEIAMQLI